VEIGNLTLVQEIREVQAEQAALSDPRLALETSPGAGVRPN